MTVCFLILLSFLLLEHYYFSCPSVLDYGARDPLTFERFTDLDLIAVGCQQRIELDR